MEIDRRQALKLVTTMLGGIALVGGNALLTACQTATRRGAAGTLFTAQEVAFLDEVAETILPETSTPGAKAAETGAFMALMVTDTYYPEDQRIFREGMRDLDARCNEMHGLGFMAATPRQRHALLEVVDREQKTLSDARSAAARRRALADVVPEEALPEVPDVIGVTASTPAHYFRMMKELALLGYFTSEIGYTQAMRYVEAPGRYEPCVAYTPGEKIWAPHA